MQDCEKGLNYIQKRFDKRYSVSFSYLDMRRKVRDKVGRRATYMYHLCFEQKYEKYQIFSCLVVKFSIHLNRHVFVMFRFLHRYSIQIRERVANSVDPDQTSRSVASGLGLYCLLMPVPTLCPNTLGYLVM